MKTAEQLRQANEKWQKSVQGEKERIEFILDNHVEPRDKNKFLSVLTKTADEISEWLSEYGFTLVLAENDNGKREYRNATINW